jgi:hypothetical protein
MFASIRVWLCHLTKASARSRSVEQSHAWIRIGHILELEMAGIARKHTGPNSLGSELAATLHHKGRRTRRTIKTLVGSSHALGVQGAEMI